MAKTENVTRLTIHVHPGAKRNEVLRCQEGVWHIKVAAPPVEGKANKALVEFLSDVLGVSKSRITIEKGAGSRHKIVTVAGMSETAIRDTLSGLL